MKKLVYTVVLGFATISASAQTFLSTPLSQFTFLNSPFYFEMDVSGVSPASFSTNGFKVTLNVDCPATGNLVIQLISPDGSAQVLHSGSGYTGDDFTNTVFSTDGVITTVQGTPPYTDTFLPYGFEPFYAFTSTTPTPVNGTWKLKIDNNPNTGFEPAATLLNWKLTFNNNNTIVNAPTTVLNVGESFQDFVASPNPAIDMLLVKSISGNAGLVSVFDAAGRIMLQQELSGNRLVDVSSLPTGIYTIKLVSHQGVHCTRFTKQ